jgi:hypothetical protein
MNNIPDGFEEVIPEGFEEVGAEKAPSNSMMKSSMDYYRGLGNDMLRTGNEMLHGKHMYGPIDTAKGVGEAILNQATGLGGLVYGGLVGASHEMQGLR